MADQKELLRLALKELAVEAAKLSAAIPGLPDTEIVTRYEDVARRIANVERVVAGEGDVTPFDDFLNSIGRSVVDAQEKIDEESRKYLEGVKDKPFVQPSVFRIPSVKAEMKFALEKVDSKRIGLVFYRHTTQAKELHQQSLSFEITAVPPSAELTKKLMLDAPAIRLELVPEVRKQLLDIVATAHGVGAPLTDAVGRPRVVIWKPGDTTEYFLFRATKEKLGVWYLSFKSDGPEDAFREVVPYEVVDRHGPLRAWIVRLAEAQVTYFTELG